jgi:Kdo2-lipid IVA lauroyltransferase/acyltransferase
MNLLVAWFMAFSLWALMVTPACLSYRLAACVAWCLTPIVTFLERRAKPKRTSLRRNFQIAYGRDLREPEIRELTHRVLRHVCASVVDFARIPAFNADALAETVTEGEAQLLRDLVAEGNGLLAVGGHIGVFTLLGHMGGMLGLPLYTISTPRKNPHLQRVVHERQTGYGQKNIDKRGIARLLREILTDGDMVGVLVDEEAKHSDIFLPFMGTLATINPLAARLHLITGAPICVLNVHRTSPGHYRLKISGVIKREKGERADRKALQREIMVEINELLEDAIRIDPAHWLWSSRRWRTRPPGEAPTPDGIPPRAAPPILPEFIARGRPAELRSADPAAEVGAHGDPTG